MKWVENRYVNVFGDAYNLDLCSSKQKSITFREESWFLLEVNITVDVLCVYFNEKAFYQLMYVHNKRNIKSTNNVMIIFDKQNN